MYECRMPAGAWVPDAQRAQSVQASRAKAVGALEIRGQVAVSSGQGRNWARWSRAQLALRVGVGMEEPSARETSPPPPWLARPIATSKEG